MPSKMSSCEESEDMEWWRSKVYNLFFNCSLHMATSHAASLTHSPTLSFSFLFLFFAGTNNHMHLKIIKIKRGKLLLLNSCELKKLLLRYRGGGGGVKMYFLIHTCYLMVDLCNTNISK